VSRRKGEIVDGFGPILREARKVAGMTQEVLSEASGVAQSAIADLENNSRSASLATAAKLAKALKIKQKLSDFAPGK
jgi:transcriptional regulator with XRE-family HTH domain